MTNTETLDPSIFLDLLSDFDTEEMDYEDGQHLSKTAAAGDHKNTVMENADEEVQDEQRLFQAAATGDHKTVLELLNAQVPVDPQEYNKKLLYDLKNYITPLQAASANGHEICVQILIEHGAEVNAKDRNDATALHMAAERGHYLCVKALLESGADCNVPIKNFTTGSWIAMGGMTPLHLAAAKNHVNCVEEIIKYGGDYNATDQYGRTSLYLAAQRGFSDCVLVHLRKTLGRSILSLPSLDSGNTPLHFAVTQGMVECVKELLYLGSDPNWINKQGFSPLHLAVDPLAGTSSENFQLKILELLILLGYNTDIDKPDASGQPPLNRAYVNASTHSCDKSKEIVKILIAYGANVNIKKKFDLYLLEEELNLPGDKTDILQYIVRSKLTLPRLNSLYFCRECKRQIRSPAFHQPMLQQRLQQQPTTSAAAATRQMPQRLPPNVQDTLQPYDQPQVWHWHFQIMFNQQRHGEANNSVLLNNDVERANDEYLREKFEKHEWYEKLASNPRTLQHHCRHAIRSTLGVKRLKYIEKLNIPSDIKSYLLLKYGD